MRVEKLELQNFRAYERFTAELHPELTLFVGENGAGKSALLEAISVGVGSILLGSPVSSPRSIHDDEVRRAVVEHNGGLPTLERRYPVVVTCHGVFDDQPLQWTRELRKKGGKTTWGGASQLRDRAAMLFEGETRAPRTLPVIAFYSAFRMQQKRASELKAQGLGSRLNAYVDCLDPSSDYKLLSAWMRDLEQARLQRIAGGADAVLEGTVLDAVEAAVTQCVPRASGLTYDLRYRELHLKFGDGRYLPFRMLSDGYRQFVGMVADIAWRTAQLNPHLGKDAPKETSGVVLIDEIDLHLHPAWQRQALADLRCAFPRVQFVVTTHSPQVVSTANKDWMRLLQPDATKAVSVGFVEGRDSNALLEDVFGVASRPEWAEQALSRIAEAIEAAELDDARERVAELESKFGGGDAALTAARWEIELAEGPDDQH